MNLASLILGISALTIILYQAVTFSKVTSCRQEGWLKSMELLTHQKIDQSAPVKIHHHKCGLQIYGSKQIAWKEISSSKLHGFKIRIKGNL